VSWRRILEIIPKLILWCLLPAWIAAGFLDWICHRRSNIAARCGPWESIFHILLLLEAGTAILLGLFFELNEPVLFVIFLCFLIHEATVYFDIRYAHVRREISPAEQRVHDFMTAIPVAVLSLVVVLKWGYVTNLVSQPSAIWTEPIRLKIQPLPPTQIAGILVVVLIGNALPYLEELLRGIHFVRRARNR
jgi:hypothetical protein